ncbi:Pre-rRNA-processing protein TSR2-domain-containing protein, partial [Multifurca ochricompacta]
ASSTPNPTLVLFARGVIARLELWPALRVAVEQGWGGPESREKRRWLTSVIVDVFEEQQQQQQRPYPNLTSSLSSPLPSSSSSSPPSSVLDAKYIALMLAQVLEDEFNASIEDGSIEVVAADVVALWGASEDVVKEWERKADGAKGKKVDVREVVNDEDEWEDEESGESGDEAPELVSATTQAQKLGKHVSVVDEDGFTLVQKGRR